MLPERKYYDIEGAAEYLGCSVSDVQYYLKEGYLRYAVKKAQVGNNTLIANEALPAHVCRLAEGAVRPDLGKCFDIQLRAEDAPETSPTPEFIYVRHADLPKFYVTEDEDQLLRAHLFETLDGSKCTFWFGDGHSGPYRLWGDYVGRIDDDGILTDALLTTEELERLPGSAKATKTSEAAANTPEPSPLYAHPAKADDIAIDLCKFANRYVDEHGKEPTPSALLEYMLRTGGTEIGMEKKDRDAYLLNGKKINQRNVRDRLSQYRRNAQAQQDSQ